MKIARAAEPSRLDSRRPFSRRRFDRINYEASGPVLPGDRICCASANRRAASEMRESLLTYSIQPVDLHAQGCAVAESERPGRAADGFGPAGRQRRGPAANQEALNGCRPVGVRRRPTWRGRSLARRCRGLAVEPGPDRTRRRGRREESRCSRLGPTTSYRRGGWCTGELRTLRSAEPRRGRRADRRPRLSTCPRGRSASARLWRRLQERPRAALPPGVWIASVTTTERPTRKLTLGGEPTVRCAASAGIAQTADLDFVSIPRNIHTR